MSMLPLDFLEPAIGEERKPDFVQRLSKIPAIGVVFAAMAAVVFATGSLCAKLVETVDPIETVLYRSVIQTVIYGIVVAYNRENMGSHRGERLPLLARCICGFITACCNYYSIQMISLGDASTISFSSPVFVSILACLCLGETCGVMQGVSALMTVIGVILICKPPFLFGGDDQAHNITWMLGVLVALGGSLTRAVNIISLRRMRRTPSSVVIFYFSASGILQGAVVALIIGNLKLPGNLRDTFLLLGVGLTTALGQLLQTVALKLEEAGPVSMARTLDIVMSFVYQVTLLNTPALWTDLTGAAIVCASVIMVGIHKWYQRKPEAFKRFFPGKGVEKSPPIPTTVITLASDENKSINYLSTSQSPSQDIASK